MKNVLRRLAPAMALVYLSSVFTFANAADHLPPTLRSHPRLSSKPRTLGSRRGKGLLYKTDSVVRSSDTMSITTAGKVC
jgi:hypothetical protein